MASLIQPPGEDASIEAVKRYANALRQQALAFSTSLATTTQLLSQALSTKVSRKRPELPPFDHKNIEAWIRRTENAFTRAEVKEARDKFAHLESVISVDLHPSINAFFSGSATQAQYNEFLAFLRKRYGRTKQQKVKAATEGVRRGGRLPVDLAAMIHEQFDDVTVEDLKKAHFMAEMPQTVRNLLADKQDNMSLDELAESANSHFNQDGSLRASNPQISAINPNASSAEGACHQPIAPEIFTPPFDDGTAASQSDINAINRPGNYNTNRANSRSRKPSRPRGAPSRSSSRPEANRNSTSNPNYCWLHNKHGDNANYCKPPCSHPRSNAMQQQQQQPGNGRGGRR